MLLQNRLGPVRHYIRTHFFLPDSSSEPPSFCQILPHNSLVSVLQNPLGPVRFYLSTAFFLSDFTSEPSWYCQILPQKLQVSARVYSGPPSFHQTLPQNTLVLPDFTAEPSHFYKILSQNILCSVRNCLRTCQALSDFSSEPPYFC